MAHSPVQRKAMPEPTARGCHRSPWQRPDTFPLFQTLIDGSLTLTTLRQTLPDCPDRRWTRLVVARPPQGHGP